VCAIIIGPTCIYTHFKFQGKSDKISLRFEIVCT